MTHLTATGTASARRRRRRRKQLAAAMALGLIAGPDPRAVHGSGPTAPGAEAARDAGMGPARQDAPGDRGDR